MLAQSSQLEVERFIYCPHVVLGGEGVCVTHHGTAADRHGEDEDSLYPPGFTSASVALDNSTAVAGRWYVYGGKDQRAFHAWINHVVYPKRGNV